ncbi:hypothetical protein A9Q84_00425 [Halobacteriovorax marinus]|uniref:Lipoprotein n=1 Tax=Halobacteriovorax marinus TaxID=97084 RepID=A0A1Y5FBN0_9BACT|nr:hypothetical protein A9Q84_00425 [Halobacteriovorax marinus]
MKKLLMMLICFTGLSGPAFGMCSTDHDSTAQTYHEDVEMQSLETKEKIKKKQEMRMVSKTSNLIEQHNEK